MTTALHWIMWPVKCLANIMAIVFNFWMDKTITVLHWITWPLRILINVVVASYDFLAYVCSYLTQIIKKQFDDPIKNIESALEVIWMVVSPFIRAVIWLCEIMITVKRYIKVGDRDSGEWAEGHYYVLSVLFLIS